MASTYCMDFSSKPTVPEPEGWHSFASIPGILPLMEKEMAKYGVKVTYIGTPPPSAFQTSEVDLDSVKSMKEYLRQHNVACDDLLEKDALRQRVQETQAKSSRKRSSPTTADESSTTAAKRSKTDPSDKKQKLPSTPWRCKSCVKRMDRADVQKEVTRLGRADIEKEMVCTRCQLEADLASGKVKVTHCPSCGSNVAADNKEGENSDDDDDEKADERDGQLHRIVFAHNNPKKAVRSVCGVCLFQTEDGDSMYPVFCAACNVWSGHGTVTPPIALKKPCLLCQGLHP